MKTAIVYSSVHHENTKKIVEAMAKENDIELIDATKKQEVNLEKYDLIGFASGIYYSKFHRTLLQFAQVNLPENKDVFFVYTSGSDKKDYSTSIKRIALEKNANIKGTFFCRGYDTYGPLKIVGGINKNRPDENDLKNAADFIKGLL